MIIEERRGKARAGCSTAETAVEQNTLLTSIAKADAVRHREDLLVLSLNTTLQSDIVVMAHSSTVNFVLPVGIVSARRLNGIALSIALTPTQETPCLAVLTIVVLDKFDILLGIHHVQSLHLGSDRHRTVVADLDTLSYLTLLGSDEDDTIAASATIDSRCTRVLENRERLYVVRIDQRKGIGHTLVGIVVHDHTINDDERVVACIERRAATYANLRTSARLTTGSIDHHACHLALKHLLRRGYDAMVLLVRAECHDTTRHVILANRTVTDDHSLLKKLGILFHDDSHVGRGLDLLGSKSHVRKHELLALLTLDLEFSIHISHTDGLPPIESDAHAHKRLTQVIQHDAFDHTLCKGADAKD